MWQYALEYDEIDTHAVCEMIHIMDMWALLIEKHGHLVIYESNVKKSIKIPTIK